MKVNFITQISNQSLLSSSFPSYIDSTALYPPLLPPTSSSSLSTSFRLDSTLTKSQALSILLTGVTPSSCLANSSASSVRPFNLPLFLFLSFLLPSGSFFLPFFQSQLCYSFLLFFLLHVSSFYYVS